MVNIEIGAQRFQKQIKVTIQAFRSFQNNTGLNTCCLFWCRFAHTMEKYYCVSGGFRKLENPRNVPYDRRHFKRDVPSMLERCLFRDCLVRLVSSIVALAARRYHWQTWIDYFMILWRIKIHTRSSSPHQMISWTLRRECCVHGDIIGQEG